MYSAHNEEECVVAERIMRTLKIEIYKYMASISKAVYIDKLNDIVLKWNNTYHSTIKIKPYDVKESTCVDQSVMNNDKDPKFEVGDRVRISKYKYIFAKGYTPNWSAEVSVVKEVKNTVRWTYVVTIKWINYWNILQKRITKDKSNRF